MSASKRRAVLNWVTMLRRRWQAATAEPEPEPEPEPKLEPEKQPQPELVENAHGAAVEAWGEEGAAFFSALAALEAAAVDSLTSAERSMVTTGDGSNDSEGGVGGGGGGGGGGEGGGSGGGGVGGGNR